MTTDLSRTFKLVTLWLVLGAAVFVGVQWWLHRAQEARFQVGSEAIEIRRGADGHYHWPGRINGRAVDFLVDTGATSTAVSAALAGELGLEVIGNVRSQTANGVASGQWVRADVALRGGVSVTRLRVTALPGLSDNPLLGMDVLGKLHWSQRDGVLRIEAGTARGEPR